MSDRSHVQDWLQDVPPQWEVPLLKLVTQVESGHTPSRSHPEYWVPDECTIPWFSLADIWQLRDGKHKHLGDTKEKVSPLGIANSAARILPAGTVVLSRTASVGFSGVMPRPMATTQDFVNFVCGPRLSHDFLVWVLRGMKPEFERLRRGSTHKTIYMPDALQFRTPLPPLPTQKAIADFLDRKTAAIDALIEKKQKLLGLLAEKRAALINHAVTKGLDPGVPMKDSGIPWIGEIPAHWSLSRLSFRYSQQLGKMLSSAAAEGPDHASYLGNKDVQWDFVDVSDLKMMHFSPSEREKFSLRRGDLLVCEGGIVGRTAVWRGELDECFFQKAIHRLRPHRSKRDHYRFFFYCMRAATDQGLFEEHGNKSTIGHLTGEALRAHRFPFSPAIEQVEIATWLDKVNDRVARTSMRLQQQIDRLQEYRQALITAAVTGQLDIPEEAA